MIIKKTLVISLIVFLTLSFYSCGNTESKTPSDYGKLAYKYLEYIDKNLPDRDCTNGSNYKASKNWIINELKDAGYTKDDIKVTNFTFVNENNNKKVTSQNISVTKKGTSDKQIIIGAHYDGTGTSDNGSGTALALANAKEFFGIATYYNLTFVFFSAEEYGLWGSCAYADSMSKAEIKNTQYMINIDSILCGDYCYLYGGVADFKNKTVKDTKAYENAKVLARKLKLDIKANPWTFDNLEPTAEDNTPSYPGPSTGDWSDHYKFYKNGMEYIYFEATNWDIGDYDGYEETEKYGPIMNTNKDNLKTINSYFPGRARDNLTTFDTLLKNLLIQKNITK